MVDNERLDSESIRPFVHNLTYPETRTENCFRINNRGVSFLRVRSRPWQLIRFAKFPNVIDRKRILSRHSRAEVAPLRRANASAFQRLVGALNDFADRLAIGNWYKNVRISWH